MSVSTPQEKEYMFTKIPSDKNRRNTNVNIINKNKNVDEWGGVSKAIKKIKNNDPKKIDISTNFPVIGPDLAHDVESNSIIDYSKDNMDKDFGVRPPVKKKITKDPGLLMKGKRRKKVGKGSYQRGTPTKTKMVLAPHRNPTNKKVRVADRPGKARPKNTSGSSRFSGGGLVASLYESF